MLIVLSPAKKLDFKTNPALKKFTQPDFLNESELLIQKLRRLTVGEIARLMGISPKLAMLNHTWFKQWTPEFSPHNAKQAILAFKGDVYAGIQAEEFSTKNFETAQNSIRILSGLYGVLRPLDLIKPYRLEMGQKLETERGNNLYQFWNNLITQSLNNTLKLHSKKHLINLASNEYFKSIHKKNIEGEVITPVFKDLKQGQYKVISFYAKRARGLMSRFIILNKLSKVEDLKAFNYEGYSFNPQLTKNQEWVFTRDH